MCGGGGLIAVRSVAPWDRSRRSWRTHEGEDRVAQFRQSEGFAQMGLSRPPLGAFTIQRVNMTCHDQRSEVWPPLPNPTQEFVARHRRHQEIGNEQVDLQSRLHQGERRFTIICDQDLALLQRSGDQIRHQDIVVDDQNALDHA